MNVSREEGCERRDRLRNRDAGYERAIISCE